MARRKEEPVQIAPNFVIGDSDRVIELPDGTLKVSVTKRYQPPPGMIEGWGGKDGLTGPIPPPAYDGGPPSEFAGPEPMVITDQQILVRMALDGYDHLDIGVTHRYEEARRAAVEALQREQQAQRGPQRYVTTVALLDSARRCTRCGRDPGPTGLVGEPNGAGQWCKACYPAGFAFLGEEA